MRIGVIGGGAAGMTAAIFAAKCGGDVTILEHTGRVGKKIFSVLMAICFILIASSCNKDENVSSQIANNESVLSHIPNTENTSSKLTNNDKTIINNLFIVFIILFILSSK